MKKKTILIVYPHFWCLNLHSCNAHQEANAAGTCECIDYCKNTVLCHNGGTCQLNCTDGSERGYSCQCPSGYSDWDCSEVVVVTSSSITNNEDDNTWLIVLLVCLAACEYPTNILEHICTLPRIQL